MTTAVALHRVTYAAAMVVALALSTAAAAPGPAMSLRRPALPQLLWVLQLDGKRAVGRAGLKSYRTEGFNAVLAPVPGLSARGAASVRRRSARARLLFLRSRRQVPSRCAAIRRRDGRCVLAAASVSRAIRLARRSAVDLVVVPVSNLAQLNLLKGRPRGRIVATARLDGKGYDADAWMNAMSMAATDPRLDLGVRAVSSRRPLAAHRFGNLMREWKRRRSNPPTPPPPPPPPGPPPLPPASVFMSPSGSDANPCTQPEPCRSFDRTYRVATPGATVEVAGGSYPGQAINPDASKTSPSDVVFRPAPGATVTVTGEIDANGSHFELRDMTIHQANFPSSADDVTFRNVSNHGLWMQGPTNISIIGGEISCGFCGYHPHLQNGGGRAPTNILFDGVDFHDWHSAHGEHVECLQILGGDNVTIRNSIFRNCGTGNGGLGATADLHLQAYGTPAPRNILLENNFFYRGGNPYPIQGEDFHNFDLRYNSIAGPVLIYNGPGPGTDMDFVGNVLRFGSCTAQSSGVPINWRYNVIDGGTCGLGDRNAAGGFLNPNSNLHLAAGSAAVNAGDPSSYPRRDIDGQSRPAGSAPDAGADEAG